MLPEGFSELEALVGDWALATEPERYRKRLATSLAELRLFYDAIQPRMNDVMEHLRHHPAEQIDALPTPTRALFHLALSYFEASHPIELKWRATDLDDAFPADRIEYEGPSTQDR